MRRLFLLLVVMSVLIVADCNPRQECDYPPGSDCDIRPYCCV